MSSVHRHRVRYHEVDAQSYLFNARFLEISDVAMAEFFRGLGWSYPELVAAGLDPSLVRARLEFRRPARLDDLLEVTSSLSRVGTSSFEMCHRFRHRGAGTDHTDDTDDTDDRGTMLAEIDITYVNVDAAAAAARPIPPALKAAMTSPGGPR